LDLAFEAKKVSIHAVLRGIGKRPGEKSGLSGRISLTNCLVVRLQRSATFWLVDEPD
jgi:hypothetical protein